MELKRMAMTGFQAWHIDVFMWAAHMAVLDVIESNRIVAASQIDDIVPECVKPLKEDHEQDIGPDSAACHFSPRIKCEA